MSQGEDGAAAAATLRRIEQKIDVLAWRLAAVEERVGIVDLKLEALDSIWESIRDIVGVMSTGEARRLGGGWNDAPRPAPNPPDRAT